MVRIGPILVCSYLRYYSDIAPEIDYKQHTWRLVISLQHLMNDSKDVEVIMIYSPRAVVQGHQPNEGIYRTIVKAGSNKNLIFKYRCPQPSHQAESYADSIDFHFIVSPV